MLEQRQPLRTRTYLAIGAASAIFGLLPWIITGMHIPLQNLWAISTTDMPIGLLPFSQYCIFLVAALIVIGSTVAGAIARATAAQHPRSAFGATIGGVVGVQVIAMVQTAIVVTSGLQEREASTLYVALLVAGTVAAILLGVGILVLIARAPKAGALVGVSIAAIALSSWLGGLFFPVGSVVSSSPLASALSDITRVAPAIVIGAAIAWAGIGSIGRVIAAIIGLLMLWFGPTLVTAVSSAVGSRVLLTYPSEMLDQGFGVFRMAIAMPELWLPEIALAVGVAFVGVVGRRVVERRRVVAVT